MTATPGLEPASPETEGAIADDLVRRGLMAAPLVVALGWFARGGDGAASAAFALVLVLINFLAASRSLAWAARISPGLYLGVAMGGYFVRLGLITVAVVLVRNMVWVDLPTVGVALAATHLVLLVWELRFVSLTLAAPGLKPVRPKPSFSEQPFTEQQGVTS